MNFSLFFIDDFKGKGKIPHTEDKSGKADTDPIYDLSEGKAGRPEGRIRIQFQNSVKGYGKRTTHWLKEEVKDGRRPKEFSNEASLAGRKEDNKG